MMHSCDLRQNYLLTKDPTLHLSDFENGALIVIPMKYYQNWFTNSNSTDLTGGTNNGKLLYRIHSASSPNRRVKFLTVGVADGHKLTGEYENSVFVPTWMYPDLGIDIKKIANGEKPQMILKQITEKIPNARSIKIKPLTWKFLLANLECEKMRNRDNQILDLPEDKYPRYDIKLILAHQLAQRFYCGTLNQVFQFSYKTLDKLSFKIVGVNPCDPRFENTVSFIDAGEMKLEVEDDWTEKLPRKDKEEYESWMEAQKVLEGFEPTVISKNSKQKQYQVLLDGCGDDSDDDSDDNKFKKIDDWGKNYTVHVIDPKAKTAYNHVEKPCTVKIIQVDNNKYDDWNSIKNMPVEKKKAEGTAAFINDKKEIDIAKKSMMASAINKKNDGWGGVSRKL